MSAYRGKAPCPYLDELIALLDEEADTRHSPRRPQLRQAMSDLALQATFAGASALTISMIQASKTMIQVGEWLPPPTLQ